MAITDNNSDPSRFDYLFSHNDNNSRRGEGRSTTVRFILLYFFSIFLNRELDFIVGMSCSFCFSGFFFQSIYIIRRHEARGS